MNKKNAAESNSKSIAENKKARYNYFIEDQIECGIVLEGSEVKSMRLDKASIIESYASIEDNQLWLINSYIPNYKNAKTFYHDERRRRKLLVKRREISKLKAFEQIYTLAMISPFSVSEKQKVLEVPDLNEAASTLNEITKFGFYEDLNDKDTIQ